MVDQAPGSQQASSDSGEAAVRRPFVRRVLGALALDATVYAEVEDDPPALLQAFAIVLLAGLARGLVARAADEPLGIAGAIVIALASWVIVTFLLWLVGVVFDHDTSSFFELMRTVGYAASPLLVLAVAAIPPLAVPPVVVAVKLLTHLAAAIALVVASREALDVSTTRAVVICGVVVSVLALAIAYVVTAIAIRLQGVIDVVVSAASQT